MTDFLVGIGIEQIPHTEKSYLAHLIAVFRDLEAQGSGQDVCRAGMFHSIYGTEKFQGFTLPLERRGEVRDVDRRPGRGTRLPELCHGSGVVRPRPRPDGRALPDHRPHHRRGGLAGTATTSTTCAASTSSTGWSRSDARANGTIAGRPTAGWPSGWARRRRQTLNASTRKRPWKLPHGNKLASS